MIDLHSHLLPGVDDGPADSAERSERVGRAREALKTLKPQELRAKNIGHIIISTTTDPPWSHQFCCMISATADYVNKYPVATKRAVRAILKAADLCVTAPQMVAQQLVDRNFLANYEYALQTLKDIRYDRWREYDAEDSLRFYALRMQETGFIKSSPNQIIAQGTDWRFLNELKRELKT